MTGEPVGALPTVRGVSCVLAHTPGLLRYGSKPTRELAKDDETLLGRMQQHLRSFEDSVAYPPNQVFIGNRTPESLWDIPEPWWRYRDASANPRGPFGQIVSEDAFWGLLRMSDDFGLVDRTRGPGACLRRVRWSLRFGRGGRSRRRLGDGVDRRFGGNAQVST